MVAVKHVVQDRPGLEGVAADHVLGELGVDEGLHHLVGAGIALAPARQAVVGRDANEEGIGLDVGGDFLDPDVGIAVRQQRGGGAEARKAQRAHAGGFEEFAAGFGFLEHLYLLKSNIV